MLEAVIFDMDGVIVDSESGFFRSKLQLLTELGITIDIGYHYADMGTTSVFTWTKMKEEFNLPLSVDELIRRANEIRAGIIAREGLQPLPGVLDLIRHLHENGVKLAIASSSSVPEILQTTATVNCQDYFQAVVSGCDCQNSKPFPDVFLKAAEQLGVQPDGCLVIEDSRNGSLAAKAAQMTCIGFANPAYPSQDLSTANLIVSDFAHLTIDICRQLL